MFKVLVEAISLYSVQESPVAAKSITGLMFISGLLSLRRFVFRAVVHSQAILDFSAGVLTGVHATGVVAWGVKVLVLFVTAGLTSSAYLVWVQV